MECPEARLLLDNGLRPGSQTGQRANLNSHLAHCVACRAYREQLDTNLLQALLQGATTTAEAPEATFLVLASQQRRAADLPAPADAPEATLLHALLDQPAPIELPLRSWPAAPSLRPRTARPQRKSRRILRYLLLGLVALLVGGLGFVVGKVAYAAYTVGQNVAAMQLAAVGNRPSTTPILNVPGATTTAGSATPAAVTPAPVATKALLAVGYGLDSPSAGEPGEDAARRATVTPASFLPSPTPIMLPSVGGADPVAAPRSPLPLPTLMATAPVVVPSGAAINLLLLGSDRRPGESWTTRSDAMVVLHLDPQRQRVALLSLPRDLIVPIPGYGQARINAATVYGDIYPELGGGAELARQTVSGYLGIPIDHVLRTDFQAFVVAIDAIGGVDIDVEGELYDPEYPTMDYGYMEAYFAPGPQHMDGSTALVYARIRHMDSNYARNRRQQQVLLAIMHRVRAENLLGQVQMISDLSTALRDDIQTDLTLEQMLGLAWAFRNVAPAAVERYALDETMVSEGVLADDPYATFADPATIELLVGQLLGAR